MGLTKRQKRKNALIQKEQQQLLKIQKELENVLLKVNDTLNALKVEELQLNSSAVIFDSANQHVKQEEIKEPPPLYMGPSVSNQIMLKQIPIERNVLENVNQQAMDLEIKTKSRESEEDDD